MPFKEKRSSLDPVVITALGVVLFAVAIVMVLLQSNGSQGLQIPIVDGYSSQIAVAFITGLTTGGLSCLAVQGGLLASSLAHQIEQDYLEQSTQKKKHGRRDVKAVRINTALPILLFLLSKTIAYTLLGALLGWLGSYLSLSPTTRSILMIAIGIFMVGNGLRMFNVHPIFRYFSIEPLKFITRYIRKTAKGTDAATPLFLGALTVFIPCGVTQAMMATALGTGSATMGAALMFAFILGTSPVFFIVAYLATELGARLEKFFMRFVAAIVLILGFVTINSGLNLIGSPLSFNNLTGSFASSSTNQPAPAASYSPQEASSDSQITLNVRSSGYFPRTLNAPANVNLTLNLITSQTYSCARDFVIPALNYYKLLPADGTEQVAIPPQAPGTRLFFTCSMGMYTGQIVFDN